MVDTSKRWIILNPAAAKGKAAKQYPAIRDFPHGRGRPFGPFRLSEAPVAGYQLPHSTWMRRHSHRFELIGESGNKICICLRFENSKGGAGSWGPVITAIIP